MLGILKGKADIDGVNVSAYVQGPSVSYSVVKGCSSMHRSVRMYVL